MYVSLFFYTQGEEGGSEICQYMLTLQIIPKASVERGFYIYVYYMPSPKGHQWEKCRILNDTNSEIIQSFAYGHLAVEQWECHCVSF